MTYAAYPSPTIEPNTSGATIGISHTGQSGLSSTIERASASSLATTRANPSVSCDQSAGFGEDEPTTKSLNIALAYPNKLGERKQIRSAL